MLWGLGLLLSGVFFIWFTKRYPNEGRDIWKLDLKGYLGGIGCIIVGLLFLLKAFSHK
jgi:uncharacterized membrane protein HdeD (DUF308 family)